MNFSRSHILMLAAISIFTGMIAPAASSAEIVRPYAMTNMQYVAFVVLFSISILFLSVNLWTKKLTNFLVATLITLIFSLLFMTIAGFVKNFSGVTLQWLSWGWIFLVTGLVLLFIPMIHSLSDETNEYAVVYERILGFVGAGVLFVMSIFVISIAKINSHEMPSKMTPVSEIFWQKTETFSGILMTPAFEKLSLIRSDRSLNSLSFIGTQSGASIWYPGKISLQAPENISKILTISGKNYIITKNGDVMENKEYKGKTGETEENAQYVFYQDTNGVLQLVSPTYSTHFTAEWSNIDKIIFNPITLDVFWRADIEGGQAIFKNGKKMSEIYPAILRYTINQNGNLMLVTEDSDHNKIVIKDGVVIHTISADYVRGTLQLNGSDVIYAIHNTDDESYSIVINGSVLDRRLAEIREVFLEKNTNGYAYFGRPKGEDTYCLFTRFKGNLCGITAYMSPSLGADGSDIIFAGNRAGIWSVYKNTNEFITETNYGGKIDISHDYFFFDKTNGRHFVFIEKIPNGYVINKSGKKLDQIWKDIDTENLNFGYNGTIIVPVQDETGWHIAEI